MNSGNQRQMDDERPGEAFVMGKNEIQASKTGLGACLIREKWLTYIALRSKEKWGKYLIAASLTRSV